MSGTTQVIGIGAGGHAKLVIDTLLSTGGYELVGLVDANPELWGTSVLGVPVLGGDELLPERKDRGVRAVFVGTGSVGDTDVRQRMFRRAVDLGFNVVSAVHSRAWVSLCTRVGMGTIVMAQAVVGPDVWLGENVAVNAGAIVDHDCRIGDHVQVATGARVAGGVEVEAGAHIGIGASVKEGIRIGTRAVVGGGAMVIRDVPDETVVVGVPARRLKVEGKQQNS